MERENFYYNNNKTRFLFMWETRLPIYCALPSSLHMRGNSVLARLPRITPIHHYTAAAGQHTAPHNTHAHSWHIVNLILFFFIYFFFIPLKKIFIYLKKKKKFNNYLCVPEFEWVLKMRPIRPVRAVPGIECVEIVDWAVGVEATSKSYAVCASFYLCRWPGFPIPMNLYLIMKWNK